MKSIWKLYFDGLTEPTNPGGRMAWGMVLKIGDDPSVTIRWHGTKANAPENTNNKAEYTSLGMGLKKVIELKATRDDYGGLECFGDSKLVVEQVSLRWQVKSESIAPFHARVLELLKELVPWSIEWIPREQNYEADEQSRLAYQEVEGRMPPERTKWK